MLLHTKIDTDDGTSDLSVGFCWLEAREGGGHGLPEHARSAGSNGGLGHLLAREYVSAIVIVAEGIHDYGTRHYRDVKWGESGSSGYVTNASSVLLTARVSLVDIILYVTLN